MRPWLCCAVKELVKPQWIAACGGLSGELMVY